VIADADQRRAPASAIYEGWVRHRRYEPREHAFTFPLYMAYLDLGELERVFGMTRWWSDRGPAPARFRRADYLGDADVPLDEAVRRRVAAETGRSPTGPIRMLTHLRQWGYVFNPVTFYYCFDRVEGWPRTIVAEITNTPWKERHAYVLDDRRDEEGSRRDRRSQRFRFDKAFHVSPFMPMDLRYDWALTDPGERLGVHMALEREGRRVFDATLRLRRRELSPRAMRGVLVRYPLMTARVIGRIHFEALRLRLKRVPVSPHPASGRAAREAPEARQT